MGTRTVAYLRVSSEKQAEYGVSLDAQRAKVIAYAQLFDLDLVAIEVDAGESAKTLSRPALQRALGSLTSGAADAVLVVKLDRLTRSVRDLCDLVDRYFRDARWALLSVGEQIDTRSASGRMVLQMLTVIGEWERSAIGERTAAALQHLAAQGKRISGRIPYGYVLGPDRETLVVDELEQQVISKARALRAAGASLRDISATLADAGYYSRAGRPFDSKAIGNMTRSA